MFFKRLLLVVASCASLGVFAARKIESYSPRELANLRYHFMSIRPAEASLDPVEVALDPAERLDVDHADIYSEVADAFFTFELVAKMSPKKREELGVELPLARRPVVRGVISEYPRAHIQIILRCLNLMISIKKSEHVDLAVSRSVSDAVKSPGRRSVAETTARAGDMFRGRLEARGGNKEKLEEKIEAAIVEGLDVEQVLEDVSLMPSAYDDEDFVEDDAY